MHIVLLSGGSGKRLWPLSNDIRSKQFIKIFKNESGQYESMVQRVYGQIKRVLPEADVTIATSKSQVSSILNQLGEQVGISVEPCRRDTFPAIALSAAYLADVRQVPLDEPVVVCPVDPLVEDEYFAAFAGLCEQVLAGEANLVLMGIEPAYPSEKYGYIIPEDGKAVSRVRTFKEKPDKETAGEYISQGALWNGGVFAFRLGYLMDKAHELIEFADYRDLLDRYAGLRKISFDYAVVEQETRIQVMRFQGTWKDLGTWNTLTEAMDERSIGEVITNDTCENVHVINALDVPLLAIGLKNVVVSASPEGILVSDKEQSAYIKPYVDGISQQVMFAEKSWGSYRVMNVEAGSLTVLVTLKQGHSMNYHSHQCRDEVWTALSGYGRTVIDGEMQNIKPGDVVKLPSGCKHTVFADTDLKLLEVQLGQDISVGDKIKHDFEPDTSCFGSGDIRGIYPTQVNEELAYRIGRYFRKILSLPGEADADAANSNAHDVYSTVNGSEGSGINSGADGNDGCNGEKKRQLRIAVGHDIRLSGPSLKKALVRGLTEAGCDVVDIGQCGTEMIYFATAHGKLDGGIMVTASHNPKSYNGFKLVGGGARPISKDSGLKELERFCRAEPEQNQKEEFPAEKAGMVEQADILQEYIDHLLSYVDMDGICRRAEEGGRRLRIVVNAGNGAAGPVIDALADRLPFEFIKLNNTPDGNFPNGVPNPLLMENRAATADAVVAYKADAGIAWDGDFDRCFMFDENGSMIEGYYMVGLLAEAFLKKFPQARIIHDPRVYWNTRDICRSLGGEAVLCRSGHSFIKAKMREIDAVYGGEMSAHHYFRDFAYCDSGMIPWLLVLELLQQGSRKFSALLAERMAMYPCSGEINSKVDSVQAAEEIIGAVQAKYADGQADYTDGLSVAYPDWRFNIRKSNTEPVIRLNVETRGDRMMLQEKTEELLKLIRSAGH